RRVVGDEEQELLDVVHLQHQSPPVLGEHRQLHEAEHVGVEVDDLLPVLGVEQVSGQAHRDVVEARIARPGPRAGSSRLRRSHRGPPRGGTIITLAASEPSCRPSAASSRPSSGTSSASTSTSTGTRPDDNNSSARGKPSWSYTNAPVITSSFNRMRLLS